MLAKPFKNKTSRQLTDAHLKLKKEIDKIGFTTDVRILDDEVPELHRDTIEA